MSVELKTYPSSCPRGMRHSSRGLSQLAPNSTPCHEGDWEHKNRVWTKVKTNEENAHCEAAAYSKFNLSAETLKMMDQGRKFQMIQGETCQFAQFDDPSVEDEYKGDDLVHKRSRCSVAMLIHVIGIVLHTFFTLTPEYAPFDFQVLGPDL
jgi:hypothetical protein